jgi:hypothetical protein
MHSLLWLLGAAAFHDLLTGQLVFSVVFVGTCELPNWLLAAASAQPALAPGQRGVFR